MLSIQFNKLLFNISIRGADPPLMSVIVHFQNLKKSDGPLAQKNDTSTLTYTHSQTHKISYINFGYFTDSLNLG